jgi:methyl-accepting chemotaxis protein
MLNVEEMEKLIANMRGQAATLNQTADAMETMIAPIKQNLELMNSMNKNINNWMQLFTGYNK